MRNANEVVVRTQQLNEDIGDMRTTAVVLAIDFENELATWGHLGDSRLYCFREQQIVVQTRDHSVVQSLVEAGLLDPKDLRTAPDRSKLLAALGDLDSFEPRDTTDPFPLQDRDKFLLCTDGLTGVVTDDGLATFIAGQTDMQACAEGLGQHALDNGSRDNVSAIMIEATEG